MHEFRVLCCNGHFYKEHSKKFLLLLINRLIKNIGNKVKERLLIKSSQFITILLFFHSSLKNLLPTLTKERILQQAPQCLSYISPPLIIIPVSDGEPSRVTGCWLVALFSFSTLSGEVVCLSRGVN